MGQEERLGQEGAAAPHIQLIDDLERENSELRLKCEELEAKFDPDQVAGQRTSQSQGFFFGFDVKGED